MNLLINGSVSILIFEYSCQNRQWELLPENKLASEYIYPIHPGQIAPTGNNFSYTAI